MNKSLYIVVIIFLLVSCQKKDQYIVIETDYGIMRALLYNSTPKHRDNMVKLVKENFYDDLLFHRVMKGFMIQGGDPDSRNATPQQMLGQGGPGYQLDEEIGSCHFRGALSAARMPDEVNPDKKSSGSQFFIVQGTRVSDQELDQWEKRKGVKYNPEQRKLYREVGGYPSLDNDYTVFGEIVEGMEVVDKITQVQVGQANRPAEDVKMKIRLD